jgi:hypothetical protein
MASITRILGITLLLFGILLLSLINIAGIAVPPFGGRTGTLANFVPVGASLEGTVTVGDVPEHPIMPFYTNIKATFLLQSDSSYSCVITLMFESESIPIAQEIPGTQKNIDEPGGVGEYKQVTITTMISPQAASEPFTISLKLNNIGSNTITVATRRVDVVYYFFGLLVPGLLALIGIVLTVLSFVKGKKSSPEVKKRAAPGGWEPTLQWSSGSGGSKSKTKSSKKQSKMVISSSKGSSGTKTKMVKKTVPQGGAQVGCKFCGKQVPQNAFFCPHCYGKLK